MRVHHHHRRWRWRVSTTRDAVGDECFDCAHRTAATVGVVVDECRRRRCAIGGDAIEQLVELLVERFGRRSAVHHRRQRRSRRGHRSSGGRCDEFATFLLALLFTHFALSMLLLLLLLHVSWRSKSLLFAWLNESVIFFFKDKSVQLWVVPESHRHD